MSDQRSAEAQRYRRMYKTARWQRLRERVLTEQPLCVRCLASGTVEPATVVHHGHGGHKGDEARFWDESILEPLCKPHHDSDGKLEDAGKAAVYYGVDGYPIDP